MNLHQRLARKAPAWQVVMMIGLLTLMMLVAVQYIGTVTRWWNDADGNKANLLIQYRPTVGTITPLWKEVAQGYEQNSDMLEPVIPYGKELELEKVRIDHVFDGYDLVSRTSQGLHMNFSKLDRTVLAIRRMGAQPVFALSYMPAVLNSRGDITGAPDSWNDWEFVVKSFIEHYSGEMGLEDVYYEVWNEPDLFGKWDLYSQDKNYLELYQHTAKAAKDARSVKNFFLGGPATTGMYPNWISTVVKAARENNWQLDFVSWHRYDKQVESYVKDAQWVQDWLQAAGEDDVAVVISEWGHTSENDTGYDTGLAAAHGVAVIHALQDTVDHLWAFELKDGLDPQGRRLWGRWGMLTHDEGEVFPKPRYAAWRLMNRLGEKRLAVFGEGTWVKALASETPQGLAIIITNYDPAERHWESVPLTIRRLPEGTYRWRVEESYGSVKSGVMDLNFEWQTTIGMRPNTVALIELQRI